jgi:hypothetical protein
MSTLTAESVALDSLRPHPNNPRNGDTEAIQESLRVNGQFKPIVVADDGTILAGNHTYAAAAELGWDTISVVRLPVTFDSEAATRIMLADNRTSDLGRYDDAQLAELLQLLDAETGLVGTGYDSDDLSDLLALEAYRERSTLGELMTHAEGASAAAKHDGSVRDPGYAGWKEEYVNKDTRSLILPYAVADYDDVIALLTEARTKAATDNNAAAVRAALAAYVA